MRNFLKNGFFVQALIKRLYKPQKVFVLTMLKLLSSWFVICWMIVYQQCLVDLRVEGKGKIKLIYK